MYRGCEGDEKFCYAHSLISAQDRKREIKRLEDKAKYAASGMPFKRPLAKVRVTQPSRVQSAEVLLPRLPSAPMDHTAPWSCGSDVCEKCEGKPSYNKWRMSKRDG